MKSFWECKRLFFEDLPTVRDLILSADWDILAHEVSNSQSLAGSGKCASQVRAALEDMSSLAVRKPSKKMVFLPYEYYAVGSPSGLIDRRIEAALIKRSDFKTIEELSAREELLFSVQDCRDYQKRENKRLGSRYPDLHAWSLTEWEKTLSYRVWMQGDYSRKERYQALACIIQEMLTFGLSSDSARQEQQAVKKRIEHNVKAIDNAQVRVDPIELLLHDFGLESSTDDYESSYEVRLEDAVFVMNHNVSVDLHRRVADLSKRMRRAAKHNTAPRKKPLEWWR